MNKNIKTWKENNDNAFKALNEGNLELANKYKKIADKAYKEYCDERIALTEHYEKCANFGKANHIFMTELPKLFKSNQELVKKVTSMIKEDKNLLSQFRFYDALKKFNGSEDSRGYVVESLELASQNIDYKTINESNKKLAKLFVENDLDTLNALTEAEERMYEQGDFVLRNKKTLNNLNEINNAISSISQYVNNHKTVIEESTINVDELINEYNKKYGDVLNEAEQSLVKIISDARAPLAEKKQAVLFNKFKNECIDLVNKLLKEAKEDEKTKLNTIKQQLEEKVYNPETIVTDIAKLLEVRDTLLDD